MNYFRPAIYHYQAQANPFFWRRKLPRMDVGAALSDLVSYPKCVFTGQIITQTLTYIILTMGQRKGGERNTSSVLFQRDSSAKN